MTPQMRMSTTPTPAVESSIVTTPSPSSTLKPGRRCSFPNTLPYTKPNTTAAQPTAARMRPSHMPFFL